LCAHELTVLTDVAPARGTHRGRATPRDEPGETVDALGGRVVRDGSWRDMGGVAGIEGVAEAEAGVDGCESPRSQRSDGEGETTAVAGFIGGRAQRVHGGGQPVGRGEKWG